MGPASDVQDKQGSTNLNTVHDPNNQLCVEIRSSANALQQNEMGSSGDEHAFKVRKPYTITKQRERWTEEEHNKFLEAVKLYGRAWHRIEEHIGTKTAVQIRSHAQKFFTKVGRDSAGNNSGTITPIEIPPPRPKRKPMHPYPRKFSSLSSKGGLITQQQDRSSSPQSVSGQENGSPTSVLSGIGPSFLNFPSNCTSPISSAAGSSPVGMLMILKENEEQSQNASAEDSLPLFEGLTNKEQDLTPEDDVSLKEDSSAATDLPTLKLFGRTVLVTDSQKPCFPTLENAVACSNTLPTANVESHSRNIDMDSKATGLAGQCAWSAWPSVPPLFYCLPSSGNLVGATEAPFFPLPWWFYGGDVSVFIPPQNATCTKDAPQSCRGEDDKVEQIEGSWTGSNTASTSEAGIVDKSSGDVDSQSAASSLKSSENLASNGRKVDSDRPMRGFVPYKRCVAERETENLQMANEEGEGRRLRLCL